MATSLFLQSCLRADVAAIALSGAPAPDLGDLKPFTQAIPGTDAKFEMLPIPAGSFQMGSPASEKKRHADEGPQLICSAASISFF